MFMQLLVIDQRLDNYHIQWKSRPWAQLGGGHGGRPPTFSDSGDIICHDPTFFSLGFVI